MSEKSTNEYPTYPIYHYEVRWVMDERPGWSREELREKAKSQWEGLPAGRIRNSYSGHKMFRDDLKIDEVRELVRKNWETYDDKKKGVNPSDPEILIKLAEREEWCLTWFSHYTFDIGQSDDEVLRSFEAFLVRKGIMVNDDDPYSYHPEGGYCAMGAEDRWRWGSGENDKPPCRCDDCKRQGIIRIDH